MLMAMNTMENIVTALSMATACKVTLMVQSMMEVGTKTILTGESVALLPWFRFPLIS